LKQLIERLRNGGACWLLGTLLIGSLWSAAPCAALDGGGSWTSESVTDGPDAGLCRALHARLNEFAETGCAADAIETYPDFTSPPWESLDPKKHISLIIELMRYQVEGPRAYFQSRDEPAQEIYRHRAQQFVDGGGELKVWRTTPVDRSEDEVAVGSVGTQTIVELAHKAATDGSTAHCPGESSHNLTRFTFIVRPDLSGPDPAASSDAVAVLGWHWLVLYGSQLLSINHYSVARDGSVFCMYKQKSGDSRRSNP